MANIFKMEPAWLNEADEPEFAVAELLRPEDAQRAEASGPETVEAVAGKGAGPAAFGCVDAAAPDRRGKLMDGCERKEFVEWVDTGRADVLLTKKAFDELVHLLAAEKVEYVEGLPEPCVLFVPKIVKNAKKVLGGYEADTDSVPAIFMGMPFFTILHCSEAFKNEWERLGFRGLNFIPAGTLTAAGRMGGSDA